MGGAGREGGGEPSQAQAGLSDGARARLCLIRGSGGKVWVSETAQRTYLLSISSTLPHLLLASSPLPATARADTQHVCNGQHECRWT